MSLVMYIPISIFMLLVDVGFKNLNLCFQFSVDVFYFDMFIKWLLCDSINIDCLCLHSFLLKCSWIHHYSFFPNITSTLSHYVYEMWFIFCFEANYSICCLFCTMRPLEVMILMNLFHVILQPYELLNIYFEARSKH